MSELARKRWKLLGDVLSNRCHHVDDSLSSVSVRRFTTFGLLTTTLVNSETSDDNSEICDSWYLYTCEQYPQFSAYIRHVADKITLNSLLGFNNTGNVCVWPSEEVLTYYCLKNAEMFRDKSVCELGGGMTCLAGIALALNSEATHVLLTDGNEQSVANVQQIISRNYCNFRSRSVKSRLLRWSKDASIEDLEGQFDCVVSADCLFFDEGRHDLVMTIYRLLHSEGQALIVAPRRGDTLQQFVNIVSNVFVDGCVQVVENYDPVVSDLHSQYVAKGTNIYDESIHYPLLIRLFKTKLH